MQISLKSLQLRSGTCQKEARCTAAFPSWYTLLRSLKHLVRPEEATCLCFVFLKLIFWGRCLVLLNIMISQGNTCLPACQESSATEAREKDPPWSPIFTWRKPPRFGKGNDLVRAREWEYNLRGCVDKMPTGQMPTGQMPTGHNANQKLAFCPDLFLWLAFCLSQLFGWHFVRTISTCFGILSKSWKSPLPLCC